VRRRPSDVAAVELDRPGRRRQQPRDDVKLRRLAGAVRSDDREQLSPADREVEPVQCLEPSEAPAQTSDDVDLRLRNGTRRDRIRAPQRRRARRCRETARSPRRERRGVAGKAAALAGAGGPGTEHEGHARETEGCGRIGVRKPHRRRRSGAGRATSGRKGKARTTRGGEPPEPGVGEHDRGPCDWPGAGAGGIGFAFLRFPFSRGSAHVPPGWTGCDAVDETRDLPGRGRRTTPRKLPSDSPPPRATSGTWSSPL
jgi:hypothetical protein